MNSLAWLDDRVLPLAEARIELDDPGYLLGDGVFESLRVRRSKPFRWDLHAQRLARGLEIIGVNKAALGDAQNAVQALAGRAIGEGDADAAIRVQVSRSATGAGRVSALLRPLPQCAAHLYIDGARLAVAHWRCDPDSPLCGVKSLSFLPQAWTRRAAQARGFDDALIMNRHERVCEASYANVIARRGKTLFAPGPEEGALDGVTRRVLLDDLVASAYSLQPSLSPSELACADEVMLTSTYAGVIPVSSIESVREDYAGPCGELARQLTQRYSALLGKIV